MALVGRAVQRGVASNLEGVLYAVAPTGVATCIAQQQQEALQQQYASADSDCSQPVLVVHTLSSLSRFNAIRDAPGFPGNARSLHASSASWAPPAAGAQTHLAAAAAVGAVAGGGPVGSGSVLAEVRSWLERCKADLDNSVTAVGSVTRRLFNRQSSTATAAAVATVQSQLSPAAFAQPSESPRPVQQQAVELPDPSDLHDLDAVARAVTVAAATPRGPRRAAFLDAAIAAALRCTNKATAAADRSLRSRAGSAAAAEAAALSRVLCALRSSGHRLSERQASALAGLVERHAGQMDAQSASLALSALAAFGHGVEPRLLDQLGGRLAGGAEQLEGKALSQVLWACSELQWHDRRLVDVVVARLLWQLQATPCSDLSTAVASLASLGHRDAMTDVLLDAVAEDSLKRLGSFQPEELAALLRGYAELDHWGPLDLKLLDAALKRLLATTGPLATATTAAESSLSPPSSLGSKPGATVAGAVNGSGVAREAGGGIGSQFSPTGMVDLALACAKSHHETDDGVALLDKLCGQARGRLHEFSAPQLVDLLWALSKLRYADPGLYLQAGRRIVAEVGELDARHVADVLFSFAAVNCRPGGTLLEALQARAMALLHRMTGRELCNTLWALASMDRMPAACWARVCGWLDHTQLEELRPQHLQRAFQAYLLANSATAPFPASTMQQQQQARSSSPLAAAPSAQQQPFGGASSLLDSAGAVAANVHVGGGAVAVAAAAAAARGVHHTGAAGVGGGTGAVGEGLAGVLPPRKPHELRALPGWLAPHAQRAWRDRVYFQHHQFGRTHQEVINALTALGMPFELGQLVENGLYMLDVAVEVPRPGSPPGSLPVQVGIEVDHGARFTVNRPHLPLGDTLFGRRFLCARGVRVVNIERHRWQEQSGVEAKVAYLQRLLSAAAAR